MDKIEFTKLIKEVVSQSAIEGTIDNLKNPPGRKPQADLLTQSKWFNSLSDNDQKIVGQIISEAVHESVFGFLCVIDGVRSISDSNHETNGLNLSHNGLQLNEDSGELLHDIYNNV